MRTTALAVALAFSMLLSACAGAQPSQASGGDAGNAAPVVAASAAPSQTPTQEPIAAFVNGKTIPMAAFQRELNRRLDGIKALGDPMPSDLNAFKLTVLDAMIDQMLIEEAAAVQKVTVTDAEVDTEMQTIVNIAGSKEKWQAQLAADRMTEDEFRAGVRSTLITQKMRDIVTAGVGNTAEQVHARHILVSSEATAKEVLGKLKAGTDFAALAAQYSQDTSTKDTGGDLGWFAKGELLESSVEDAAFSLQLNQVSSPVKSNLGYHIIQTLERVKDRPISPETHAKLAKKAFELWLQSLEKSAKIEKYPNGHVVG